MVRSVVLLLIAGALLLATSSVDVQAVESGPWCGPFGITYQEESPSGEEITLLSGWTLLGVQFEVLKEPRLRMDAVEVSGGCARTRVLYELEEFRLGDRRFWIRDITALGPMGQESSVWEVTLVILD